jgi:hypothetical protein
MRVTAPKILSLAGAGLLAGCAMQPVGPSVAVFPAPFKPFEVFQQDQDDCADYASRTVAGGAEAANSRALGTAAIGTALGLALGAATGDGHAASFGAAGGAAVGSTIGANQSEQANFSLQRRYDNAYAQCMYAHGNQVPGFERPYGAPPPPPNTPPPPPPPRRG